LSTQDDEAARIARAKRIREEIDHLTGVKSDSQVSSPGTKAPKSKLSPREFTDKAAAEAAREADRKV
jgi:hypothetical protein